MASPWSLSTLNFGYFIGGASDIALQQTSGPAIRGQIYEQGSGKSCGPDAGTGTPGDPDAGTGTPDAGTSTPTPPSGTTSSSSGGTQPAPTSTATTESPASESDGGGCSTAASGPTSALSFGLAAIVLGGLVRRRRRG